jgi:hypothetical protein
MPSAVLMCLFVVTVQPVVRPYRRLPKGSLDVESVALMCASVCALVSSQPGISRQRIARRMPAATPAELDDLLRAMEADGRIQRRRFGPRTAAKAADGEECFFATERAV